jgi:hypothetical protein
MPDLSPHPENSRSHDVYFYVAGSSRLVLRNPNHGIVLDDTAIAWTKDGAACRQAYADIVAVHLQTAALGNAANVIDQCKIEFVAGPAVTVSNASSSGLPDKAQTPLYRDFVRDFHARLTTHGCAAIRFTAGHGAMALQDAVRHHDRRRAAFHRHADRSSAGHRGSAHSHPDGDGPIAVLAIDPAHDE